MFVWLVSGQVGGPSSMANTVVLDNMHKLSTRCFYTYHAFRHHWLLNFCIAFSDLGHSFGSQSQRISKVVGIIFFQSFSLDHDKILFDVEVILVEYFDISLESGGGGGGSIYWITGNNCCLVAFTKISPKLDESHRYRWEHRKRISSGQYSRKRTLLMWFQHTH